MSDFTRVKLGSSLKLQLALYYNSLYSLAYFPMMIAISYHKHAIGLEPPRGSNSFISAMGWPILLVTTLTEVFRLYFGWGGNLQEQVSHMSSFLLVTAFPVFPCVLFLAFALPGRFFFEMAGGIIELVFLFIEFVLAYRANKKIIRRKTAAFLRLCQEDAEAVGAAPGSGVARMQQKID